LDQAQIAGVKEARLFLAGEPLLHPRIDELVGMAKSRGMRTVIHTNTMLLDEKRSQALVSAGLDEISFSINGTTPEDVHERQPGAELGVMASNVRAFLKVKQHSGSKSPLTILQIIQDQEQLKAPLQRHVVRELFGSPGPDRILRLPPHGWAGQLPHRDVSARGDRYFPCQPLWQSMSVSWDGKVFACCGDLNGTVVVGDLTKESFLDVWYGQAMASLRQLVAANNRESSRLCAGCDAVWWDMHPVKSDMKRFLWRLIKGFGPKTGTQ
jgi:MoaA/NifB/PqqE/SkfB family radical SAM enzyme